MNRLSIGARWTAAVLLAFAGLATAAPPQRWTLIDIGAATGDGNARAMNRMGDVVGNTPVALSGGMFTSRGFLWQNGMAVDVGAPIGAQESSAEVVSDRGTVYFNSGGVSYAWKDGRVTRLPFAAFMHGVNRSETVVGGRWHGGQIGSGGYRAFMYRDGMLIDLPDFSGTHSDALSINDHGVAVGYGAIPFSSDTRPIVWENGVLHGLTTFTGPDSAATRINNHGLILGSSVDSNGVVRMMTWDLGTKQIVSATPNLSGHDLNNHGAIVGSTWPDGKPFLLDNGVMTMLLELRAMREAGWVTFAPFAINDRGWIVGVGWKPGVSSFGRPLLLMAR
jgi:uncharacterized membrane protein